MAGPAKPVLRCTTVAPTLPSATVATTYSAELRASRPTRWPASTPRSASACAIALLRWSISAYVVSPSSSMTAIRSGWRAAPAAYTAAGVSPYLTIARAMPARRSGRTGASSPVLTRTRAVDVKSLTIGSTGSSCPQGSLDDPAAWVHSERMSEVVPFPRSGDVVDDVRGEGRTLRVTTHDDSGLVVVSIWYGGTCAASAWLSR